MVEKRNKEAFGIILAQIILAMVLFPLALIGFSWEAGCSLVIGVALNTIPSLILYKLLFLNTGAQSAKKIVKGFYLGETLKILATFVLFALALQISWVRPGALFIGFILALMIYWAHPILNVWLRQSK